MGNPIYNPVSATVPVGLATYAAEQAQDAAIATKASASDVATAITTHNEDLTAHDIPGIYETISNVSNTLTASILAEEQTRAAANTAQDVEIAARLLKDLNLGDVASASQARANLGLGTAATLDTGTSAGQVVVQGSAVSAASLTVPFGTFDINAGRLSVPTGGGTLASLKNSIGGIELTGGPTNAIVGRNAALTGYQPLALRAQAASQLTLNTDGSSTFSGALNGTTMTFSGVSTINGSQFFVGRIVTTTTNATNYTSGANNAGINLQNSINFAGGGTAITAATGTMSHASGVVNGLFVNPTNSSTGITYGIVGQVNGSTGTRIPLAARNASGVDVFTVSDAGNLTAAAAMFGGSSGRSKFAANGEADLTLRAVDPATTPGTYVGQVAYSLYGAGTLIYWTGVEWLAVYGTTI